MSGNKEFNGSKAIDDVMKEKISISLSEEALLWIREQIKVKKYSSVSHCLEFAVYQLRESSKKE